MCFEGECRDSAGRQEAAGYSNGSSRSRSGTSSPVYCELLTLRLILVAFSRSAGPGRSSAFSSSRLTGIRLRRGNISSLASTVMQHRVSDAQEAAQEPSGRAAALWRQETAEGAPRAQGRLDGASARGTGPAPYSTYVNPIAGTLHQDASG